jgi:excisionase family DNA binding protein
MEELKRVIISLIDERIAALRQEPEYLTPKEASKLLKVSAPTLISMMKSGRVDALRLGGRVLIDKEKLTQAMQNGEIFKYQRIKKG